MIWLIGHWNHVLRCLKHDRRTWFNGKSLEARCEDIKQHCQDGCPRCLHFFGHIYGHKVVSQPNAG